MKSHFEFAIDQFWNECFEIKIDLVSSDSFNIVRLSSVWNEAIFFEGNINAIREILLIFISFELGINLNMNNWIFICAQSLESSWELIIIIILFWVFPAFILSYRNSALLEDFCFNLEKFVDGTDLVIGSGYFESDDKGGPFHIYDVGAEFNLDGISISFNFRSDICLFLV